MSEIALSLKLRAPARAGVLRVIRAVAAKELLELRRDARFRILFGFVVVLLLGALVFGATQAARLDRERQAAAAADRELWTGQSAKDPHAAAHFGQYAFKPLSPLALADPGVDAYAGSAVWLEAHKQNPALFRAARDAGASGRLGELSLAFALQKLAPLVVILLGFSAFSGERERGTLRQALGAGVSPAALLAGKALALLGALALLLAPALLGVCVAVLWLADSDAVSIFDQFVRVGALALGYGLTLAGFVFLTLAVSALARSSRAALAALIAFWLVDGFLAPRLAGDVARALAPAPTAQQFQAAIAADKRQSFGHDESHPAFVAFRDETLKRYGVARVEDLPVNFRGLALRRDDEMGYAIFDRHSKALQDIFERQDALRALPGPVAPLLALQPWSMSFAGTDARHHADFLAAAEAHRRVIQTLASDDLIRNARNGDAGYAADPSLWARFPELRHRQPGVGFAFANARGALASLCLWLLATLGLAVVAARRLRPI